MAASDNLAHQSIDTSQQDEVVGRTTVKIVAGIIHSKDLMDETLPTILPPAYRTLVPLHTLSTVVLLMLILPTYHVRADN